MSITYTVRFEVRSDRLPEFHRLLGGVLDAMREEPNFRNAVLHVDPERPHSLMLYETWADHEDVLANQLQRPYRAAWHAALPELLAEPRAIAVWVPMRADGALAEAG